MQALQPSLRHAVVVEIPTSRNGCLSSSQKTKSAALPATLAQFGKSSRKSSVLGAKSPASASLTKQAVPSMLFATLCAAKCWPAVQSKFVPRASRLRRSRQSVHFALRQGAASPSLATLRRLHAKSLLTNQVRRALQGGHKQCSIGPCHCLPPPRMRCLTTRSTGPIAACG